MTPPIKLSHAIAGLAAGAALVGGGYALAAGRTSVIHACVNSRTRALTLPANGRCANGSSSIAWNQQGPRGAAGATGAPGRAATVGIGSVTGEPPGSPPSVTNSGTATSAILNFAIPQGAPGQNGSNGTSGAATGPTAYGEVWMGSGSAELAPASGANVLDVHGGGGNATVRVDDCVAATPTEPIITVTSNADASNTLSGANNTANVASTYVTAYSDDNAPNTHTVIFSVETFNPIPTTGTTVNSDFSFTVYC